MKWWKTFNLKSWKKYFSDCCQPQKLNRHPSQTLKFNQRPWKSEKKNWQSPNPHFDPPLRYKGALSFQPPGAREELGVGGERGGDERRWERGYRSRLPTVYWRLCSLRAGSQLDFNFTTDLRHSRTLHQRKCHLFYYLGGRFEEVHFHSYWLKLWEGFSRART